MNWLVTVGTIAAGVAAGVLVVVGRKWVGRRSSFSVGDRVRIVGRGRAGGRIGTIEEPWMPGQWRVRFDGAATSVVFVERALQHLPLTEFPDAKKPPAK